MTKQVLLTISGLQMLDGAGSEPVEIVTAAEYYVRNGKHYILYDEAVEGSSEHIQNVIKVAPEGLEVTRKGLNSMHMIFEKGKKTMACYKTPFGCLNIGLTTHQIRLAEREGNMDVQVQYTLEINETFLTEYSVEMNIQSKETGDFRL